MKCAYAVSLVLLVTVGFLLAGCGGGVEGPQVFVVTVSGMIADSTTHVGVPDASVTIGTYPTATTGADGRFSVADIQPAANIPFQVSHPDYQTLQGTLTLDATARTWSLTAGTQTGGGALVEESPGHLSLPGIGQAGTMVVSITVTGGDGGDDLPPPPPVWP